MLEMKGARPRLKTTMETSVKTKTVALQTTAKTIYLWSCNNLQVKKAGLQIPSALIAHPEANLESLA